MWLCTHNQGCRFHYTHLSLHQLLLVNLLDLGAVGQKVAQFHIALPQLLVPVDGATAGVSLSGVNLFSDPPPLSLSLLSRCSKSMFYPLLA